jgi:cytochrome b pre-mRNA-processing protein 3
MRRLFGRSPEASTAAAAYAAVILQARSPAFFAQQGVPDTLDGRFEMIALHVFLVLHRLKAEPAAQRFGQALYDAMFADMDRSLREMGTGDLSVGKQVKRMATALAGRIAAYQAGLAGEADLSDAVRRNLYGTVAAPAPGAPGAMADYLRRQAAALSAQPAARIAAGEVRFAPLDFAAPSSDV